MQGSVGHFVVISSASVYRDDSGRSLDEAATAGFPELPEPIAETQPTLEPGPQTYSTRKVSIERTMLDEAKVPVTVLRPCAVYGIGSTHPREWWFVKRALDGRRFVPLAYDGLSRFHTTSSANIAELTAVALQQAFTGVLNIADAEAQTATEIGTTIGKALEHDWWLVPVPGDGGATGIGMTPWSVPRPFVVDTSAARELGYAPVESYAQAVPALCRWLIETAKGRNWRDVFPVLAGYPDDLFGYAAEDAYLGTS
ncbi:MAG: NAD-dependent epimerase/dehydratase family protein [Vulcanimicrobiaceae bacterium]